MEITGNSKLVKLSLWVNLIAFIAISSLNEWFFFYQYAFKNQFADLRLITSNSECLSNGLVAKLWEETCDPWMRISNYPTIWIEFFSWLKITEDKTFFLGVSMGSLTLVSLNLFLLRYLSDFSRMQKIIFLGGIVHSLPLFMLLERGNVDQVIFCLLFLVASTQISRKRYVQIFGIFLLACATYLKLFSIGGAFLLFLLRMKKRNFKDSALILLTQGIAIFALQDQLGKIMKFSPTVPREQFGLRSFPSWSLSILSPGTEANRNFFALSIIGITIFIFLTFITLYFSRAGKTRIDFRIFFQQDLESRDFVILTLFGGSYFAAFFAGSNWFYRYVFLIPVVTVLIHRMPGYATRILLAITLLFLLASASSVPYLMVIMQLGATLVAISIILIFFASLDVNKAKLK
jgi:hypothetical protein